MADRLERVNQTLLSENNKLKGQFISQEEDRNFLIKQLVTVKKENAKLRSEFTETEKELVELENKLRVLEAEKASGWGSGGGGGASNRPGVLGGNLASTLRDSDTEERYKDVNIRCIAPHIYLTFIHSFIHSLSPFDANVIIIHYYDAYCVCLFGYVALAGFDACLPTSEGACSRCGRTTRRS